MLATRTAMAADQRELKAREAFAAQRYQDALDLFAKLYAETLHPIYLRNIGRCYQKLGQPVKAIDAFQEYLVRQLKTSVGVGAYGKKGGKISQEQLKIELRKLNRDQPQPSATP